MKHLEKILWSSQHKGYRVLAITFLVLGLCISFLSLQLSDYAKSILIKKNNAEYIIVGKEASFMKTFTGQPSQISEQEIRDLKRLKAVDQVSGFSSSQFPIKIRVEVGSPLKMDLFFESIPSHWLDINPTAFKWKKGSDFIPIIVSKEFLNLWNFGFAKSQGLPQIDFETARSIPLAIQIGRDRYKGRIVGLSNRFQTVLVPHNFLSYANSKYAYGRNAINRAVIKANDPADDELLNYLNKHGLDYNPESILKDKINNILGVLLKIFSGLGIAFLILSISILLLQLLISIEQSKSHIIRLNLIGYDKNLIAKIYMKKVYSMMLISTVIAFTLGISISFLLAKFIRDFFGDLTQIIYLKNIILLILLPLLISIVMRRKLRSSL